MKYKFAINKAVFFFISAPLVTVVIARLLLWGATSDENLINDQSWALIYFYIISIPPEIFNVLSQSWVNSLYESVAYAYIPKSYAGYIFVFLYWFVFTIGLSLRCKKK